MSPFYVENEAAYQRWRAAKLERYPATAEELVVPVDNPLLLTDAEAEAMLSICRKTNMVIYASRARREDKEIPRAVGERFGLRRLDSNMLADDDGITSLQVVPGKSQRGYIPYSDKRLLWHTDGYYNSVDNRIRAFVLHCVSPAAQGGENSLLDHEIAYILMRDANPDYIKALMAPDAMTIPANTEAGVETRPAVTCTCAIPRARVPSNGSRTRPRARPCISWKTCWPAHRLTCSVMPWRRGRA